jgi:hypothetical protein
LKNTLETTAIIKAMIGLNQIISLISIKRDKENLFSANYGVTKEVTAKNYDSTNQVAHS